MNVLASLRFWYDTNCRNAEYVVVKRLYNRYILEKTGQIPAHFVDEFKKYYGDDMPEKAYNLYVKLFNHLVDIKAITSDTIRYSFTSANIQPSKLLIEKHNDKRNKIAIGIFSGCCGIIAALIKILILNK